MTTPGLILAYLLMGIAIVVSILLEITQAFFLSNAPEKYVHFANKLDNYISGYILGLATIHVFCIPFKKKHKTPNQKSDPT